MTAQRPRQGSTALGARALRAQAEQWLNAHRSAMVVCVLDIKGSTPRDEGTRMLVSLDTTLGTIGGGHLEWQAIELSRQALAESGPHASAWEQNFPLGPALGQCCGGVVKLGFMPLNDTALATWTLPAPRFHLELHGAGHVGQAIVNLLTEVDCTVRWIDERPEEVTPYLGAQSAMGPIENPRVHPGLPSPEQLASLPSHISFVPTDDSAAEVADAPPGAIHLVLTHRHDLDLQIIHRVLQRDDFAFAGLIGSMTKRARFFHRLEAMGISADTLSRLTCPIGLPGLSGKEPPIIAISVVAQLLLLPT